MDKVLATRLALSVAIIIGYLVIAGLSFHVTTLSPILMLALILVLFVPVGKKKATKQDSAQSR
ncbi:hypothetical protein [Corynebacterium lubricantis]|uniref:hypothetical protein n=1 Tax=Corynebacterium lubricantis TaxID=541095 RepID=UPI00037C1358|nr:hypothetical protein [Corynebacterium lubricantis]